MNYFLVGVNRMMNVGARIRELRKRRGLTTTELASLIGTTQQSVSNYENNKSEPSFATMEKIGKELGVTLSEFFETEPSPTPPELNRLMETAKKLHIEEMVHLQRLLEAMDARS